MNYITVKLTSEQYWGLRQAVDSEIGTLTHIVTTRAEQGKTTTTHGKSLAFYKRLKTTLTSQE